MRKTIGTSLLAGWLTAAVLLSSGSNAYAQLDDLFDLEEPAPSLPAANPIKPAGPATVLPPAPATPALDGALAPQPETVDLPAATELPPLTLRQWVRLGSGGRLLGKVVTLAADGSMLPCGETRVSLVQNGQVLTSQRADADGEFEFRGVTPGVITIVASESTCFAAYPLTVVGGDQIGETAEPLTIAAISQLPSPRRQALVASLTSARRSPQASPPSRFVPSARQTLDTFRVAMTPEGGVSGAVLIPGLTQAPVDMSQMLVRAVRDNQVVGEARVTADGSFSLDDLGPGPVGIIFFGPLGFAATAIELVPADARSASLSNATKQRLVANLQSTSAPGINLEIAPLADVSSVVMNEPSEEAGDGSLPLEVPAPPTPGGGIAGGSGGGFGGGGGGAGGGGLGGIGGLAAIGAIIAAVAASGDDEPPFIPTPVSPAIP
ncbi:hypothetical protein SH139x_001360 [Planctomycetaceae bacterium SH139]